ncbi:hypothetical protein B0H10DRAFT_1955084 [Mycena sp. CBHHK59/15]|nr:hypothetical protein B0H10DRAFT_1955084 [Mycena sp. CBHHK59/15]
MSDQCARNANGNLKDASEIEFYESESDAKPLPTKLTKLHHGTRKRDTDKLAQSLAAEKANNDGNPFIEGPKRSRAKAPRIKAVPESVSDQEDNDFELPDLIDPSHSEGSDDEMDIDNDEISSILPSKTVPTCSKSNKIQTHTKVVTTSTGKRKQTSDSASAPATKKAIVGPWSRRLKMRRHLPSPHGKRKQTSDPAHAPGIKKTNQPTVEETRNPMYLFYDVIPKNSVGYDGAPGDKHYKCFHGNHQIITISKASCANLGKLIHHLKITFR